MEDIEKRVERLDLLTSLKKDPAQFRARLQRYVWPTLCGTDHDMLLYYYTLQQHAVEKGEGGKDGEKVEEGRQEKEAKKEGKNQDDPEMHTRLLKRIMTIASG